MKTGYVNMVAIGCRSPVFHISTYLRGMESIGWLSEDWSQRPHPSIGTVALSQWLAQWALSWHLVA